MVTELAEGSYLSHLAAPGTRGRGQRITVRVIEYTLQASESAHPHKAGEVYRLVTTILDPDLAPAEDLAAAYAQRWEIESVLDEIKTHQLQSRPVLRSRDPDGVERLLVFGRLDLGADPDEVGEQLNKLVEASRS